MDIQFEEVEVALQGPLEAAGLPAGILFGVLLTFAHDGRQATAAALGRLLGRLSGHVDIRKGWLRDRLAAHGRLAVHAEVGLRHGEVAARQRMKAARVAELANGLLATGVRDVRLRARVQRFGAPGSGDGPMLDS